MTLGTQAKLLRVIQQRELEHALESASALCNMQRYGITGG